MKKSAGRRAPDWIKPFARIAFGLLFAGLAVFVQLFFQPRVDNLATQIRQTEPISRAELLSGDQRGEILIEGQISRKNEVLTQSLVAYVKQKALRDLNDKLITWQSDEMQLPPLQIDLADGSIMVAGNYTLIASQLTPVDEDNRYEGVGIGDQVVVIGEAQPNNPEAQLKAKYIVRGTSASFLRSKIPFGKIGLGLGLVLAGAVMIVWLRLNGYLALRDPAIGRVK